MMTGCICFAQSDICLPDDVVYRGASTDSLDDPSIILVMGLIDIIYSGEFDPGSGWTLATGLTHASRGASGGVLAHHAGDRRTGE